MNKENETIKKVINMILSAKKGIYGELKLSYNEILEAFPESGGNYPFLRTYIIKYADIFSLYGITVQDTAIKYNNRVIF